MIDCTYIELNELILYPSVDYVARLDGIMDFQKDVSESELFYDGAFYGSSKITSRDLTLSVIIKHQFNDNENRAEKQLNFILKEENIKLKFKLENDNNFYECIVNCSSKATDIDKITCTLHLSDPNIYKAEITTELEKKMQGGFCFTPDGFTISSGGFEFSETLIGNTVEILNPSTTIYPTFNIKGDTDYINISNLTTGEVLKINCNISSEHTLFIDCNPSSRKIRYNNKPYTRYKSGSYISLVNGSNIIKVDYSGSCTVGISYKEVI